MNEILVESIRQNMERKTTEELFETWKEAVKEHGSEETIEAIQRVLTARGEKLPSRTLMATSTKVILVTIISISVLFVLFALINEQIDIGLLPTLLFIVLVSIIVGSLWHLGQALRGNPKMKLDYLNSLRSKRFLCWFIFLNIWPLGLALLGRLQIPYVSEVASFLAFFAFLFWINIPGLPLALLGVFRAEEFGALPGPFGYVIIVLFWTLVAYAITRVFDRISTRDRVATASNSKVDQA